MNVLVIPEDFRNDQYILKPIVQAMMTAVGQPRAAVRVCQDPRLGSVARATNWGRIQDIISRYRFRVDLFLLCIDRDGDSNRRASLDHLERQAAETLPSDKLFLAEHAWQEIEAWALAGQDLPADWSWSAIRAEPNPKERYFLPFAERRGLVDEPAQGRRTLAEEAAQRYARIRQLCPEDVAALEQRVRDWLRDRR